MLGTTALLVALCSLAARGATQAGPALHFTDATEASGIEFVMTSGTTPSREILEVNGGGVALFDYDEDGDLDLFLANGATLASPERGPGSRLYANVGGGKFVDVTRRVGIEVHRWAMGIAVADYDNDGHDDVYLTCFGPNVLLRNDTHGSGRFVDVTAEAGVGDSRWGTSAAFGDFDGDGDRDLYVVNYLEFDPAKPPARVRFMGVEVMAGPQGLAPQQDVLYENLGEGRFRDVTRAAGCAKTTPGYGLGVAVVDADLDGRLDILVGNDSTQNFLFRNRGGLKFEDIGVASGIAANYDGATQASMGIAIADVDANGYPDVFTTNFSSDTNTLYLNLGENFFDDRTSQFGLGMVSRPNLSWGTGFYDFDSDGDEDLFVASGHVYPEATTRGMDSEYRQFPLLFERRDARFHLRADAGRMFAQRFSGRAVAFGDIDGDDDVDVVMTSLNDRVRIFRNDSTRRPAAVVHLRDAAGSAHLHGTRVDLVVGDETQRRWISGGSFQSSDAPVAYFGLRATAAGKLATLRVTWPGDEVQEFAEVPLGKRITVTRGKQALRIADLGE